jgi:hypothetical protein
VTDTNPAETHVIENENDEELTLKSLLIQARGIEPLIISIFLIIIYCIISGIAFFLSWKFGRIY